MTHCKLALPMLLLLAHTGFCAGVGAADKPLAQATAQKALAPSTKPAYLSYTPFDRESYCEYTPQQVSGFLHEAIKIGIDKSQATSTYKGAVCLTAPADIQTFKTLLKQRESKLRAADFGDTRLLFEADAGETQIFVDRQGTVMQGGKYWRLSPQEFTQLQQVLNKFYPEKP